MRLEVSYAGRYDCQSNIFSLTASLTYTLTTELKMVCQLAFFETSGEEEITICSFVQQLPVEYLLLCPFLRTRDILLEAKKKNILIS
jgi:hypothetical protein